MNFPERAGQAFLDEVIRSDSIARQEPRAPRQTGDQGFDFAVKPPVNCARFGQTRSLPDRPIDAVVILNL